MSIYRKLSVFVLSLLLAPALAAQELQRIYTNPDLSLDQFDKVMLDPINFASAKIIPPVWAEDKNPRKWSLNQKNFKPVQKAFQEVVSEQVQSNGGYPVVMEADDKTLGVHIEIVSLTPYAQRDEKVQTKGSGEMVMQATLRNARTGELLLIIEGPQQVGDHYQENTDLGKFNDLKSLFTEWGKSIRRVLDKAHSK